MGYSCRNNCDFDCNCQLKKLQADVTSLTAQVTNLRVQVANNTALINQSQRVFARNVTTDPVNVRAGPSPISQRINAIPDLAIVEVIDPLNVVRSGEFIFVQVRELPGSGNAWINAPTSINQGWSAYYDSTEGSEEIFLQFI